MTNNKLQLKEDKTDIIFISPRKVLNNEPLPSEIRLNSTDIRLSQTVRKLGVTLDQTLSFQQHISNVCRTCYFELRQFSTVRHFFSDDATKTLRVRSDYVSLLTRLFHFNNIFQTSDALAILNSADSAQSVTTSLMMPQKLLSARSYYLG